MIAAPKSGGPDNHITKNHVYDSPTGCQEF